MKRTLLLLLTLTVALQLRAYEVLVLGDLHYDSPEVRKSPTPGGNEYNRNTNLWQKVIPATLKDAAQRSAGKADFAIQLGDLTQGDCGAFELQAQAFSNAIERITEDIKIPFYAIKGNHDIRGEGATAAWRAVMEPYLNNLLGGEHAGKSANYSAAHKGDLYIYFDSIVPDVNFVERVLAKHKDAKRVFFSTHLPLLPASVGGPPAWIIYGGANKKEERRKLLALLAQRNTIVLTAHIHYSTLTRFKSPEGTITQISCYSMADINVKAPISKTVSEGGKYFGRRNVLAHLEKQPNSSTVFEDFQPYYQDYTIYSPISNYAILRVEEDDVYAEMYFTGSKEPRATLQLAPFEKSGQFIDL